MALEAVTFQQDYNSYNMGAGYGYGYGPPAPDQHHKPNKFKTEHQNNIHDVNNGGYNNWDDSSPVVAGDGLLSDGRRKRGRTKKNVKNKEEMENQRMTHIAVERNRRRQMNDYLAVLRSLMPPSYAQRGDQASIVGGAINFVKELEQLVQFLESLKPSNNQQHSNINNIFSNVFTFPQYSQSLSNNAPDRRSCLADIEVTMVDSHANIKILTKRRPKQLLKMVARLQAIGVTVLHLNITTVHQSILYSFSVKVENECEMTTVNEIATTMHDIVGLIQQESGGV